MEKYIIRKGLEKEDEIVAENYYKMYIDGVKSRENDFEYNWMEITLDIMKDHRKNLKLSTIVVINNSKNEEEIIGSAVCQIYNTNSLHPHIIKYETLKTGYIWGVYINPEYRGKGLAKKLIKECNNYCKYIGCSEAKLWGTISGIPVYKNVGYKIITEGVQEMIMNLK